MTTRSASIRPTYSLNDPSTEVYVGDCRRVLRSFAEHSVDLVFANPPFNLGVDYGKWQDDLARHEYESFTREWIDACLRVLAPHGSIWVNLPDHVAAEVVMHLKSRGLEMVNWCIWHFRFGVWRPTNFIPSKSHVLYFVRDRQRRRWNPDDILVLSDRASKYNDPRTRASVADEDWIDLGEAYLTACEAVGHNPLLTKAEQENPDAEEPP